jgi:hypothetical protein
MAIVKMETTIPPGLFDGTSPFREIDLGKIPAGARILGIHRDWKRNCMVVEYSTADDATTFSASIGTGWEHFAAILNSGKPVLVDD